MRQLFPIFQTTAPEGTAQALPLYWDVDMDYDKGVPRFSGGEPVLASGLEAVKGWAWRALHTERYRWSPFSWDYGCELESLVGQPYRADTRLSEAVRYVREALTVCPYITGAAAEVVGGQYYNITRREGTRAYCDISFSGTPGLVIPKGTAFLTAGGLSYALMAAVALGPEGTGRGRLEAAEAGSAYNVEAGAIDRMYVNLTGLTDYHSEAAAGGTDAESDAALLARVRERVQRPPTSGNGYQYRQWAMEVAGVGSAKVVELPGGPGTVGVTLVDSNDRAPSEEIVEAVTAHIEEERPIGAAVTVTAAGEREVTVAAQVSLTGGAGAGAVQDAFRAALAGYLHTLIEGKYGAVYYKPADDQPYTLLYNRVLALLLNVEGVENFASLTVNGGTADVTIQAGEIPVLGEVSVT